MYQIVPITHPITREEFAVFEEVRCSGVTNMADVTTVSQLTGLDEAVVMAILKNYVELENTFEEVTCASAKNL